MRIVESILTSEGDGAEVQRLFPLRAGRMNHDPFVYQTIHSPWNLKLKQQRKFNMWQDIVFPKTALTVM